MPRSAWLWSGAMGLVLLQCALAIPPYNTSSSRRPDMLNVHLVPHTHDDGGWLKTFDQYYFGQRQDIQVASVQNILDTVVESLAADPNRKFSYAEMGFFMKWWGRQPPERQALVKQLVKDGQLNFINGGYVQHDEAGAHYSAMVDQTSLGHRFLNATFGLVPEVAWQVDPFGHSSTQASLLTALVGYSALFFGRADYQDMAARRAAREMELVWRASSSWGGASDAFTHNYPNGNYGCPPGFDWTYEYSHDPVLVDDEASPEYNIPGRIEWFVGVSRAWAAQMRGNDILYMMGSDFEYAAAHSTFRNLDMLVHYANLDGRINVMYSSPAEYVAAKRGYTNVSWPLKTDDFFPYADCAHCYWTGYFTSRPTCKAFIRSATSTLTAARQLQLLAGLDGREGELGPLGAAAALAQHHDAVTGTAKQEVANDYNRLIHAGLVQARQVMLDALSALLTQQPAPSPSSTTPAASPSPAAAAQVQGAFAVVKQWAQQLWLQAQQRVSLLAGLAGKASPGVTTTLVPGDLVATARKLLGQGWTAAGAHARLHRTAEPEASASDMGVPSDADIPASVMRQQLDADTSQPTQLKDGLQLAYCKYLNASSCQASVDWSSTAAAKFARHQQPSNTEEPSAVGVADDPPDQLLVVVYNPLSWPRREGVRVPLGRGLGNLEVTDGVGGPLPSQLLPLSAATAALQGAMSAAHQGDPASYGSQELAFMADLPPLGYASYLVKAGGPAPSRLTNRDTPGGTSTTSSSDVVDGEESSSSKSKSRGSSNSSTSSSSSRPSSSKGSMRTVQAQGSGIVVELDESTGLLTSVAATDGSWSMALTQQLMYYVSSVGEEGSTAGQTAAAARCDPLTGMTGAGQCSAVLEGPRVHVAAREEESPGQTSGAYIFRPAAEFPVALPISVPGQQHVTTEVTEGDVVTEIRQQFAPWAHLVTRLWAQSDALEQEWTVGPIPVADGLGKEVILRTTTNLSTCGTLFTDSNGREMLPRVLNTRPRWPLQVTEPVAGNYYPITSGAGITDGCLALQLATDRAQGAASLEDGQLEVMVHRRNLRDDFRGVGEPLNETQCGCRACACEGLVARGTLVLLPGPADGAGRAGRRAQQQLNDPVFVALGRVAAATQQQHLQWQQQGQQEEQQQQQQQQGQRQEQQQPVEGGVSAQERLRATGLMATAQQDQYQEQLQQQGHVSTAQLQGGSRGPDVTGLVRVWSGLKHSGHHHHQQQQQPRQAAGEGGAMQHNPGTAKVAAVSAPEGEGGLPPNVHLLTLMSLEGDAAAAAAGASRSHPTGAATAAPTTTTTTSTSTSTSGSGKHGDSMAAAGSRSAKGSSGTPKKVLLRLAHVFQSGEDSELAQPVKVDLSQLLEGTISDIEELNLSGARARSEVGHPFAWPVEGEAPQPSPQSSAAAAANPQQQDSSTSSSQRLQEQQAANAPSGGGQGEQTSGARAGHCQAAWRSRWGDAGVSSGCKHTRRRMWSQAGTHAAAGTDGVKATGASAAAGVGQGGDTAAAAATKQDAGGPWNVWDHSSGDALPVVELFPMEIRTWRVTLQA